MNLIILALLACFNQALRLHDADSFGDLKLDSGFAPFPVPGEMRNCAGCHGNGCAYGTGCSTCNDGTKAVPCLDVDECASLAPAGGRFAFILTNDLGSNPFPKLPNIGRLVDQAKTHSIDVILIVPKKAQGKKKYFPLTEEQKMELAKQHIKIMEVPGALPENMKFKKDSRWCGYQDFIRIHAFGLAEYDAVAYFDLDVELQGDVTPALRCASRGQLLTTMGAMGPLNLGFFAVKPSLALMNTAIAFAETADFSRETGWAEGGFAPSRWHFPGSECGQGFLHTLFYKNTSLGRKAFAKTGLQLVANQVDQCTWNYQNLCPYKEGFQCSQIVNHHKDDNPKSCKKKYQ